MIKSDTGRTPASNRAGVLAGHSDCQREPERHRDRQRETGDQRGGTRDGHVAIAIRDTERHCDDRAVLRPNHHCPDDQDRRVGENSDGANQARDHQQDEEAGRVDGFPTDPRFHQLPHRGDLAEVGRCISAARWRHQRRIHRLDRDRGVAVDLELTQEAERRVGGAAPDVELHGVAVGSARPTSLTGYILHPGGACQGVEQPLRQVGRTHQADVEHRPTGSRCVLRPGDDAGGSRWSRARRRRPGRARRRPGP